MLESNSAVQPSLENSRPAAVKGDAAPEKAPTGTLAAGGVLALLASVCCVGPLVLVSLGLGGAWVVGAVELFTPLRPYLIAATLLVLGFAGWRIYRPAAACEPGEVCAAPKTKMQHKIVFWAVAALSAALLTFPYYGYLFF